MSSVPGKAPSVKLPPRVESQTDLLLEELGKLLTIEETLAKLVLPQLVLETADGRLRELLRRHLEETRDHVGNLKRAFLALGYAPSGRPALGLDGLRAEHGALAPQVASGLRAGVHCAAAMGTEHYEINAYEAAIRAADALGAEEVGGLLRANLEQEVGALAQLGDEADRLAAS